MKVLVVTCKVCGVRLTAWGKDADEIIAALDKLAWRDTPWGSFCPADAEAAPDYMPLEEE